MQCILVFKYEPTWHNFPEVPFGKPHISYKLNMSRNISAAQ